MVYQLQDLLFLKGIAAQLIFIVLMLFTLFTVVEVNRCYRTGPYIKWLNIMMLVLFIYGLIPILGNYTYHKGGYANNVLGNYSYLQGLIRSVLPIYAFLYFTLKRQITSNNIRSFFFIFLISYIFVYYQRLEIVTLKLDREEITNNTGYLFVPLIPMMHLVKIKEIWKYVLLCVILVFLLLSMKRGAFLAGSIAFIIYLAQHIRVKSKTQLFYILLLSCIAIFIVYRFGINLYSTSDYFQKRLMSTLEGNTSGRDTLFNFFYNYYLEKSTWMEFFLGHGADGTISLYGLYAHNDWLEFAINQGVLGLLLYLIYWVTFIWEEKKYCGPKECKHALRDIMIVYFIITFYNYAINNMPIAATMCIGYCLGMNMRAKSLIKQNPNYHGSF